MASASRISLQFAEPLPVSIFDFKTTFLNIYFNLSSF
jgi:hypothetical protein